MRRGETALAGSCGLSTRPCHLLFPLQIRMQETECLALISHASMSFMHISMEPSILYFGTPVVLISTRNEDGTTNIAPMSSAWWLGWNCMLGLGASSHTGVNLRRERECVLNLPSVGEVQAVDRLARLTGANPVSSWKQSVGYRHEKHKSEVA